MNIEEDYKATAKLIFENKENLPVIQIGKEIIEYKFEEFENLKNKILEWKGANEI